MSDMATTMFWTREWPLPVFALPEPGPLAGVCLGWVEDGQMPEAGPPERAGLAMVSALCREYRVVFLSKLAADGETDWRAMGSYWIQRQRGPCRKSLPLVCTAEAGVARLAFEESWVTQGQMLLLALAVGDPPAVLGSTLQGDPVAILRWIAAGRLEGALLPGVDGVCAGLYMPNEATLERLLGDALPAACRAVGVGWAQGWPPGDVGGSTHG